MTTETAPALNLKTDLFINGEFGPAATGKRFATVNPATGDTLAEVSEASAPDLDRAVAAARQAYETGPWAAMKPRQRGRILAMAADLPIAAVEQGRKAGLHQRPRVHHVNPGTPFPSLGHGVRHQLKRSLLTTIDTTSGSGWCPRSGSRT